MNASKPRSKALPIAIALVGIAIEVAGIMLLASKRISSGVATPLILLGMLMAFVPLFVLARRSRR